MSENPWEDPDYLAWAERVRTEMLPKLQASALSMTIVPDKPDVKIAVELGYSILLDKPIVAVVAPGTKVPEHLVRCADEIVELDFADPDGSSKRLQEAMGRLQERGMLP